MPRADGCQATADRQGRVKGASDALGMWSRCAHFKAGAHHMGGVNITSSFGRTELQVQIPVIWCNQSVLYWLLMSVG